jgi:hypothetical protein
VLGNDNFGGHIFLRRNANLKNGEDKEGFLTFLWKIFNVLVKKRREIFPPLECDNYFFGKRDFSRLELKYF